MDWTPCLVDGVATIQCIPYIFQNLINIALIFCGIVAVAFIIVAGFKLQQSGGDTKQVESAKGTLTYAIIGLILVLLSFFIINLISYITGVDCIKMIGFTNCQ